MGGRRRRAHGAERPLTVVLKAECLEQIGQTVTLPETETTQR